jgi:hypothetical protein
MTTKLNQAFALLRKQGFIARQNFSCCQSCAGCEIANKVSANLDKGMDPKAFKGCVFYTKQDGEALKPYGRHNQDRFTHMYLSYGPVDTDKHGSQGLNSKEVGQALLQVLTSVGIEVEWDGNENTRIAVLLESL